MKAVMNLYFKNAEPTKSTNGNLFNTVNYGTAIHGGWGVAGKPKAHRKYITAGLALLVGGILVRSMKNT